MMSVVRFGYFRSFHFQRKQVFPADFQSPLSISFYFFLLFFSISISFLCFLSISISFVCFFFLFVSLTQISLCASHFPFLILFPLKSFCCSSFKGVFYVRKCKCLRLDLGFLYFRLTYTLFILSSENLYPQPL